MLLHCAFCGCEVRGESAAEVPCPRCRAPVIFPVQVSLAERVTAPFRQSTSWKAGSALGALGGGVLIVMGFGGVLGLAAAAMLPFAMLVHGLRTDRIWMSALGLFGSGFVLLLLFFILGARF